ncbi:hypothetical protein MY10362_004764 [Beauveria mimosiformis]
MSQKTALSSGFRMSISSSPASPVSSSATLLDQEVDTLEVNSSLNLEPSHTAADGTTTIASTDDGSHIRALMAKYEQVMNNGAAHTPYTSSNNLATQVGGRQILPDLHGRNDRIVGHVPKRDTQHGKFPSQKAERDKKRRRNGQNHVSKKSALVSSSTSYTVLRLGGARRTMRGTIEYEVFWAPTWLPADHLEGQEAFQEAKDLVVDLFGVEAWQKEARELGL